jgi:hypothetical protein
MHLGFVLPEQTEELTMPTQKRLWLDQEERLPPGSDYPCQEHQKKPVRLFVHRSLDRLARKMMSCCRNSAFSASSSALPRVRSAKAPSAREVVDGFIQSKTFF